MIDKDRRNQRQRQWLKDNRDHIDIFAPKGLKEKWKAEAEREGKTLSVWVVDKIETRE